MADMSWLLEHGFRAGDPYPTADQFNALLAAAREEGRQQAIANLRAKAAELRMLAQDARERRDHGESVYEQHYQRFLAQASILEQQAKHLEAQTKPAEVGE